jgi:hypothetical protein
VYTGQCQHRKRWSEARIRSIFLKARNLSANYDEYDDDKDKDDKEAEETLHKEKEEEEEEEKIISLKIT